MIIDGHKKTHFYNCQTNWYFVDGFKSSYSLQSVQLLVRTRLSLRSQSQSVFRIKSHYYQWVVSLAPIVKFESQTLQMMRCLVKQYVSQTAFWMKAWDAMASRKGRQRPINTRMNRYVSHFSLYILIVEILFSLFSVFSLSVTEVSLLLISKNIIFCSASNAMQCRELYFREFDLRL